MIEMLCAAVIVGLVAAGQWLWELGERWLKAARTPGPPAPREHAGS